MWKLSTLALLISVPTFIAMVIIAINDLMDETTGYSHHMKVMDLSFPSLTICPTGTTPIGLDELVNITFKDGELPYDINISLTLDMSRSLS